MTFRKVELVAVACDLCQAAGPAAAIHEYAEQDAAKVGITRFLNGTHCCGECRAMLGKEVEKPVAKVKAVKA
jgi:predicted PP-loop superfamily ATPase